MPIHAKKHDNNMKVDLRILCCLNTKRPDISVGEFAKKVTVAKLYNDKLKQTMISKYHLNTLLLSGLRPSATLIPFIQIMGFNCHLYVLRQVEDYYTIDLIDVIAFPTTHLSIKKSGIKSLIGYLEKAKV